MGAVIGEFIGIENHLKSLGEFLERKMPKSGGNISKGFITATLIYCVGSMAIVGAIESGLTSNHEILFNKATLDGIAAVIFTSSMGTGVVLSVGPVLIYQGSITISAGILKLFQVSQRWQSDVGRGRPFDRGYRDEYDQRTKDQGRKSFDQDCHSFDLFYR
jgi:uncharacterized protein